MSHGTLRSSLAVLVAFGAACTDGPSGPSVEDAPHIEAALEALAVEANRTGDAEAATAWSGGALAIRLGAEPTDIAVVFDGESVRYKAVVVGAVYPDGAGGTILRRSLIAWTGHPRPAAVLQVTTLHDEASFDQSTLRARGVWADLRRGLRWLAVRGGASLVLDETGEPCLRQPGDTQLRCVTASFDVRLAGLFRLRSTTLTTSRAVEISTAADGVSGVIIARIP